MNIELYNKPLHLLDIYSPAGSSHSERDAFFREELIYFLRNNLDHSIIGGDFNCITSPRDSSSKSTHICKTLLNINRDLNLKDVWWLRNRNVEFTYVRENYGSRLDRMYVKNLGDYITNIKLNHTNLSDHSCVLINIDIPNIPKTGYYYWKMNTTLLDNKNVQEAFILEWNKIECLINEYNNINDWQENLQKDK